MLVTGKARKLCRQSRVAEITYKFGNNFSAKSKKSALGGFSVSHWRRGFAVWCPEPESNRHGVTTEGF